MTNAMGLTIPTPGVTTGPEYATDVSNDLTIIAGHTHTGASNNDGTQIPTAGLNINADLSMQSNNLTSARSTRYASQTNVLSGVGDLNEVYVVNGNLYYNNASGTPIQITSGAAIYFTNNLNYSVLSVNTNHTINFADVVTVLECDTTSNAVIITLPAIVNVPAGRLYIVKDFKGTSETHAITINPSGVNKMDQGSSYTIADNHAAVAFVSDGLSNWSVYPWNRKVYFAGETIKLTGGAALTSDASSTVTLNGPLNSTTANIATANVTTANITNAHIVSASIFNATINDAVITDGYITDGYIGNSLTSPSYTFSQSNTNIRISRSGGAADPASWKPDDNGVWTNVGTGLNCQFAINPPNGCIITFIQVSFKGAGAHAGLPSNMPVLSLKRYNANLQTDQLIGSNTDTSVSVSDYQSQHAIGLALNHLVDTTVNAYHIMVTAESGTNALAGGLIYYYEIIYTRPAGSQVGRD